MGENKLNARLDSGEDAVLRSRVLPDGDSAQSTEKIQLSGALGHIIPANLIYVPLGLADEGNSMTQQVVMLCAVMHELMKDVGDLLTPVTY